MNYYELIYIAFGAVLGLLSSVMIIIVERIMQKWGKLRIYYRFSNCPEPKCGWGFEEKNAQTVEFWAPIRFEIYNSSNVTKILRDMSIVLYKNESFVQKMIQIEYRIVSHKSGHAVIDKETIFYGGEKGAYSFMITPQTIMPLECEYCIRLKRQEVEMGLFNNMRISYYDC